jgi:two-component sensor histidine kinase
MSIGDWLLGPAGLTPHGFCLNWTPGLVALHVGSDAVVGLAYFSIPLAIAEFVRRRPDLRYSWVAYLFVAFILACGTTHFMSIVTLWVPAYGAEGLVKLVTAVLSIATAVLLWPLIPQAAALPSAAQLEAANADLEHRVAERVAELRQAKQDLEVVVEERTAALAQRDLLLREVYHRVKNNLQVVDSLLLMQARRLADPDARTALENLRSRVYALGLVHHQLMGSKDLETFEIAPFLEELSRHLLEGVGNAEISLSVRAAPLKVGLDFAIPLGLLVTELVTNSMKHAFSNGPGAIEVALEEVEGGQVVLRVTDNGVGYDPSIAEGSAPSLGASIIDGLVQQLKGVLSISIDGGTRSVVQLPAPVQA